MARQQAANIKNKLARQGNGNGNQPTIYHLIRRMAPAIKAALPQHITADRMTRIALTAVRQTPQLLNCDQMSLLGAIMTSAQLGLEPNTPLGEAYLIPYKDYKHKVTNAQFQIGYKGLLTLAYRTGLYQSIYAHEVYENDEFHYEYGLNEVLKHVPAKVPEGDPIYYYGVYHLGNGGYSFTVWSREKVEQHARIYSQSFSRTSSPWQSNFDAMAKKTVLKELLKYAPKSIEFAHAIEDNDERIKKVTDTGDLVDLTDFDQMNIEAAEKKAQLADHEQGVPEQGKKEDQNPEAPGQMSINDPVTDFEDQEKNKK